MDNKKLKIAQSKTAVQLLNEQLMRTGSVAKYEFVYDWTHKTSNIPQFTCKITVGDKEARGTGTTKKKAKQNAATNMFMQLSENIPLLQTLQAAAGSTENNIQNHIGNLSMFCSRNKFPQPQYWEDKEDGPAHLRKFYWNCSVGKRREVGIARSTKVAKQLAAQAMYLKLVSEHRDADDIYLPDNGLNEDVMPFKMEKTEKLESKEDEEMEDYGEEYTEPISPEPFDDEGSRRNDDRRQEYDDRRREFDDRRQEFDGRRREYDDRRREYDDGDRYREDRRRKDRRYDDDYYRSTERPSTSGHSSRERSRNSEGSKKIRIESEEILERKYKVRLSSFTDWTVPAASPTTPAIDEIPQTSSASPDEASRVPESEELLERKYKVKLSSFTDWTIPAASPTAPATDETPQTSSHSPDEASRAPESGELLESKYKVKLSSFANWTVPDASPTAPATDETPQTSLGAHDEVSRPTEEDNCYVKTEIEDSHSILDTGMDEQSTDDMNYPQQDQESVLPTPVPSNDAEGLENVDATVDSTTEDQLLTKESEIDVTEDWIQPEVKFKIRLGGLIPSTSSSTDAAVSSEPIIPTSQVSDDRDDSISEFATSATENRPDILDSIDFEVDDKTGLRSMIASSLMKPGVLENLAKSHEDSISSALGPPSSQTEEPSVFDSTLDDSTESESMDILRMTVERYSDAPQALSGKFQDLLDSDDFAEARELCSDVDFPREAVQSATEMKNVLLDKCEESSNKDSSLCGTSKAADSGLRAQSPMDLSEDDDVSGDAPNHRSGPKAISEVKFESEEGESNKVSKILLDFLTVQTSKKQSVTDIHSDPLKDENVTTKNNSENLANSNDMIELTENPKTSTANETREILNINVCPKSDLLTVIEKENAANGNSEDQIDNQDSNLEISVVSREPEESVIKVEQPIRKEISDYYYMMLKRGIDLKPKVGNRVVDLLDAISKFDLVANPHIVEEGFEMLKDIIILIDLYLERDIYRAHDKEYIVVVRINSILEIVEMVKNKDLNEANRFVFFEVIQRLIKILG